MFQWCFPVLSSRNSTGQFLLLCFFPSVPGKTGRRRGVKKGFTKWYLHQKKSWSCCNCLCLPLGTSHKTIGAFQQTTAPVLTLKYFPPGLSLRGGPVPVLLSSSVEEPYLLSNPHRRYLWVGGKPHLAFGQKMTVVCWCCPAKDKDALKKRVFKARWFSELVIWEGAGIAVMYCLSLGVISTERLTSRFQAWGL